MNLTAAPIPIFRIFDLDKAREFYCGYLGMNEEWDHQFGPGMPHYIEMRRNGLTLHLSEHHGDCTPGATALIYVDDIDDFHAELKAKNYAFLNPGVGPGPGDDLRCMELTDPFGNRLRFMERTTG